MRFFANDPVEWPGKKISNGCKTPQHSGPGLASCRRWLRFCARAHSRNLPGNHEGFGAVGSQAFWILLGYLLSFALAVYLFIVGRYAISIAKGCPRPKARFGWGRMLLGAGWLFGTANAQFGLLPTRTLVKSVAYSNSTQVVAGRVTTIALSIGCVFLIFSGIRKGFRQQIVK